MCEEVEDVLCDGLAGGIRSGERRGTVGPVGLDHRDDTLRIDPEVGLADAILHVGEVDRAAVRGKRGAVVDVVHTVHGGGDPRVDLEDHLLGHVEPGLVVPDGCGGDQLAVLGDAGDLDDRHVHVSVVALPDLLRDVRQMDVDIVHPALVDPPACGGLRLVRHTQRDSVDVGEHAFGVGGDRRAGEQVDPEVATGRARAPDVFGERRGNGLRGACTGETADGDRVAGADPLDGFLRGHDLVAVGLMTYPSLGRGHDDRLHRRCCGG